MNNQTDKSPHILNTSSNLLGLCFIVLTSMRVLKFKEATFIDELTAVAIIFFMTSSMLSFLSIRTKSVRSVKYENVADIVFLIGLILLFCTTLLLTFNIIQ